MLSIIICHRNKSLLNSIKKNIEETVGIPYELVVIDNTDNKYTILSAYNEGVRRATYDIVCFTHEDILFYTSNWGQKVIAHFTDPEVGMIGIMGAPAQSFVPSAWWFNNYFAKSERNLLMRSKNNNKLYQYYSNPFNDKDKTEVVIIDGVWFCIRKELFTKISFDEKTYSGFHLYDADICMQVMQHAKNYVVYDILIEHFWSGNISKDYYTDLLKFADKWQNKLPTQTNRINPGYMKTYDWHALRSLVLEMKTKNYSKSYIKNILKKYYPMVKQKNNSVWFRSYFFISQLMGYQLTNSIFYRIEKLIGVSKAPGYTKTEYSK